jgi:hypothetical protein
MKAYRPHALTAIIVCCCAFFVGCQNRGKGREQTSPPSTDQKATPPHVSPDAIASNQPEQSSLSPGPGKTTPPIESSRSVTGEDDMTRDLHSIGTSVVAAVLAKDFDGLRKYVLSDNQEALENEKLGLYCYLFDAGPACTGKGRSVYEILSSAHDLQIRASSVRSPVNGRVYGLLMFYDRSQINEKRLDSDFLCSDEALKKVASWHFERNGVKWTSRTLFDYATDGECDESD